jgi:hypothetical protein
LGVKFWSKINKNKGAEKFAKARFLRIHLHFTEHQMVQGLVKRLFKQEEV